MKKDHMHRGKPARENACLELMALAHFQTRFLNANLINRRAQSKLVLFYSSRFAHF